jgi:tetratricopeptide (TPR) repeat protein
MRRHALALILIAACAQAQQPAPRREPGAQALHDHESHAQGAQLFEDLGDHHRSIATRSPAAQRFFDQGLRLAFAFNHEEAQRSFEEAARRDPSCGACYWGAALVLGPNYNQPAAPERARSALALLAKARTASNATPVERALIAALKQRYADPPLAADDEKGQAALDEAYANAMREVARRYPEDDDVQVLFAESMMDLRPWRLWDADGRPAPGTAEIVATLERVLARSPNHPGANHYYIHAVEGSPHPEKALGAADRTGGLMPGAGHLVHMPSHVYQRVGRYNEAAEANRRAIAADRRYTGVIADPGSYAMYVAHNFQFLWASALMAGRGTESLQAAREMLKLVPAAMWTQMPAASFSIEAPALSLVRFGRWAEVLREPPPPAELPLPTLLHHYARARAQAALGNFGEAEGELAALRKAAAALPGDATAGLAPGGPYAGIAVDVARGDLLCRRGKLSDGLAALRAAVKSADALPYDEPPDWYSPPRQTLGAWLLRARKAAEAEKVLLADLERNPDNGWSLTGLREALRAQKKNTADVEARLAAAWSNADVDVASSDF